MWDLDSSNFHLQLEDGLREHINSHNNRTMKEIYQATVKLAAISPTLLTDSVLAALDNQLQVRTMPVTPLSEFWLATVSTLVLCTKQSSLMSIPRRTIQFPPQ